jgi:rubredoxin
MRQFRCTICDHIYDEAKGDPETGLAPGTRFEDIPDDWMCPECGATKGDFELIAAVSA